MGPPAYPVLSAGPKPAHFHGLTTSRLDRFDTKQDYPSLVSVLDQERSDSSDFIKLEKWSSPGRTKVSTTLVPHISLPHSPRTHRSLATQTPFHEAIRQKYSPAKKGDFIGISWTNHWYKVTLNLPPAWVAVKPERIQFEWDPSEQSHLTSALVTPALTPGAAPQTLRR